MNCRQISLQNILMLWENGILDALTEYNVLKKWKNSAPKKPVPVFTKVRYKLVHSEFTNWNEFSGTVSSDGHTEIFFQNYNCFGSRIIKEQKKKNCKNLTNRYRFGYFKMTSCNCYLYFELEFLAKIDPIGNIHNLSAPYHPYWYQEIFYRNSGCTNPIR